MQICVCPPAAVRVPASPVVESVSTTMSPLEAERVTFGPVLEPLLTAVFPMGLVWSMLVNVPDHPTTSELPLHVATMFAEPTAGATSRQSSTPFRTAEEVILVRAVPP